VETSVLKLFGCAAVVLIKKKKSTVLCCFEHLRLFEEEKNISLFICRSFVTRLKEEAQKYT